jgi:hypothetical protein
MSFLVGELCPPTTDAWCVEHRRVNVATEPTTQGVTSRSCPLCRLLKYVQITETCWLWTGSFNTQFGKPTYGQFYVEGRRIGAHVASYLIHKGPVPARMDVMHSCNRKACVRPDHLSVGTRTQNVLDGFAAKPGVCAGENNGRAVLNWDIVHLIRSVGGRTMDLAAQYHVSTTSITAIKKGRKWPEAKCPVHGAAEYRRVVEAVA